MADLVAVDQGDSGGGRLVKGVVPSQVCIPASLASLVLHNPDNLCYLNAAVFLLAYVSAHWQPYGPLQGATPLEHSLCSLLRSTPTVGSRDGLTLTAIPEWSSLLQSWSSLHQQQDCMELLRHFLEENCLSHLQCRWEARPIPGSVAARRPMIQGLINVDLPLPKRTQDTTLQECIICWHEQKISRMVSSVPLSFYWLP